MGLEQEINKHIKSQSQKSEAAAQADAVRKKEQVDFLNFFEERKKTVIIPAFEEAKKTLEKGGFSASWSEEAEQQTDKVVSQHAYARFEVEGEHLLFEGVTYQMKIRFYSSRAINEAGHPVNSKDAWIAPLELTSPLVDQCLMSLIKVSV